MGYRFALLLATLAKLIKGFRLFATEYLLCPFPDISKPPQTLSGFCINIESSPHDSSYFPKGSVHVRA
jgi:hypothetical protein